MKILVRYSSELQLLRYYPPLNLNRIHDSVEKALGTANQDHVTANSRALVLSTVRCQQRHNINEVVKFKMSSRVNAGSNLSSNQDPRRENRIYRYTPVTNKPNQDPLPDYVSLLGMIFSMLGLMMRVSA